MLMRVRECLYLSTKQKSRMSDLKSRWPPARGTMVASDAPRPVKKPLQAPIAAPSATGPTSSLCHDRLEPSHSQSFVMLFCRTLPLPKT